VKINKSYLDTTPVWISSKDNIQRTDGNSNWESLKQRQW